jgi:hypothetical protein
MALIPAALVKSTETWLAIAALPPLPMIMSLLPILEILLIKSDALIKSE